MFLLITKQKRGLKFNATKFKAIKALERDNGEEVRAINTSSRFFFNIKPF